MGTERRGDEWSDDVVFDDDFVRAARVHEGPPVAKPTRESLREVKREARQRKREARRPPKPPKVPRTARGTPLVSGSKTRTVLSVVLTVACVGAGAYYLNAERTPSGGSITEDLGVADPVDPQEAAEQEEQDRGIDPWEGTAASDWPRGVAGIEPPGGKVLGPFPAADVKTALTNAEIFLEAAILDERVVYRGSVDPVLGTLEDPDFLREQYGDPDTGSRWAFLATRFRPNVIGPVGEVIRVKGSMKPVLKGGELAVRFSYAVAYAVRGLRDRSEPPQLIVVRREGELRFPYDPPGSIGLPFPGQMRYVSDHSVCGRKWPFPAFTESWLDRSAKPGDKDVTGKASHDLTDPDDSLRDIKGCFTNTGSL